MPSSGSSKEVSQSTPCTDYLLNCRHGAIQGGSVGATFVQHGADEDFQDEMPSCCTAGKHQYISRGLVLCLFSTAEEKATVMPLMPPMVMSTVTFPSSLPPYCFLMALSRSCTTLCGTQIKR